MIVQWLQDHGLRNCLSIGLVLTTIACQKSTSSTADKYGDTGTGTGTGTGRRSAGFLVTKESPDLRQRADSLAALDPWREAAAAIRRGDLRYLAVCHVQCVPIGIPADTVCLLQGCANAADLRTIKGTETPFMNADVARLDSIAAEYGARYNQLIREYRKRRRASRAA